MGRYVPDSRFCDPNLADSDGLVNYGGDLEPETLLDAYAHGIYPLFAPGEEILWYSPDPRCLLLLDDFHISSRSSRKIKAQNFRLTINHAFQEVMDGCAEPRKYSHDTWIGSEIRTAYARLYELGMIISVEAWAGSRLAGGLYGLAMGPFFCGESMFHRENEASRAALLGLVAFLKAGKFVLIDCQQVSPHMLKMGASLCDRAIFLQWLNTFRLTTGYSRGFKYWLSAIGCPGSPVSYCFDAMARQWERD